MPRLASRNGRWRRRYALNLAEEIFALALAEPFDTAGLIAAVQRRAPSTTRAGKGITAHQRAPQVDPRSDCDAAFLLAGADAGGRRRPALHARRLVRAAIEDIGLADPEAVHQALAAKDVFDFLGAPEGELALAQAVIYLATAPKSNASYTAFGAARRSARDTGSVAPPAHILNAPTRLMKDLGYGAGYEYDHDAPNAFSGQDYFPEEVGAEFLSRGTRARARDRQAPRLLAEAERGTAGMNHLFAVAIGGAIGASTLPAQHANASAARSQFSVGHFDDQHCRFAGDGFRRAFA